MANITKPEHQNRIEKIENFLKDMSNSQLSSYQEISEYCGFDVLDHRVSLIQARKNVEKSQGSRFETVYRQGIKKLGGDGVVGIGAVARRRVTRIAKTQSARLTGLRYNDISPAMQSRIDAERSLLGAIASTASTQSIERVEAETSTGPIAASKVLRCLTSAESGSEP